MPCHAWLVYNVAGLALSARSRARYTRIRCVSARHPLPAADSGNAIQRTYIRYTGCRRHARRQQHIARTRSGILAASIPRHDADDASIRRESSHDETVRTMHGAHEARGQVAQRGTARGVAKTEQSSGGGRRPRRFRSSIETLAEPSPTSPPAI
jgi:hypothetical protein